MNKALRWYFFRRDEDSTYNLGSNKNGDPFSGSISEDVQLDLWWPTTENHQTIDTERGKFFWDSQSASTALFWIEA